MNDSRNIVVIGGSGFIGSRLLTRLRKANRYSFLNFDKSPSQVFPDITRIGDVRSIDDLRAAVPPCSVIINLAAEHRDDVRPISLYDEVNVGGARNLIAVAREKDVKKILFTSSVAVYGFAPVGTDESGQISPINDYGRTKHEAEQVFKSWHAEAPSDRTLIIIRPTVVFGEQNRGNVYNLLRQIASGRFIMIGRGENRKSMAYVENVAAFIEYSMSFKPGIHIFNYIDTPHFTMNALVGRVNRILGRPESPPIRLPFTVGYMIGKGFDIAAAISGTQFAISSVRVKKFCANSVYNTALHRTGFEPPISLEQALDRTTRHEFIDRHSGQPVFFTE